MRLLGLDIGTTGCKATVFDDNGELLGKASREYSIAIPHPGWAEQDPEKVWDLAQEAIAEVLSKTGGEAVAIGLSVQGEAIMPVNGKGQALRPAILGMDTRTADQNTILRESFGAEHLFQRTGMPLHTINTLPKMLWLKQHEPEVWKSADKFLLYEDFIINKMTRVPAISHCLASRTQVYDIQTRDWSPEVLEYLELETDRLAPVRPSGFPVGKMNAELSRSLGFSTPPLVSTGGHDQACGALGVGLTRPDLAMVSTGTAEVVEVAMATPALNETFYEGNLSVYSHVIDGLYLSMTINHSGGLLLRWFRDTFGQLEMQAAAGSGQDAYDLLLENAPDEPTGLLVLPHFAGAGSPSFDTRSKGAILGLTFAHSKAHIAKAILEGTTYELRLNLDVLKKGGVPIGELRAVGGGARSPMWLQMKADITGITVAVPRVTEAASWGAAILAGTAAGCFPSASEAAEACLSIQHRYEPDPGSAARYEPLYQLYQLIHPTLTPILHRL
jgi:xylulokinase